MRPKTIQIYLPDGDSRSLRVAEITSRTVWAIEVPRARLDVAAAVEGTRQVGLYFLFAEGEGHAKPRVYVGESADCYKRVVQHHHAKQFWERAVLVTSKTRQFNKAQVQWLEWHAIREVARVGRYRAENAVGPAEPHVTAPVRADLLDAFETARILLSTLGHPLFEGGRTQLPGGGGQVDPEPDDGADVELFMCRGRGAEARAEYVPDGLLVLKGSVAARELRHNASTSVRNWRDRLLGEGVLAEDGDRLVFAEDFLFPSPSGAAGTILGANANGWEAWRAPDGRTLDEVKR